MSRKTGRPDSNRNLPRLGQTSRDDPLTAPLTAAYRYLALRARTEFEVRKKLEYLGFDTDLVEKTVSRLYEQKYLDDLEFAKSFCRSRARLKNAGPKRLLAELKAKGIGQTIAGRAIESVYPSAETQAEAALLAARVRLEKTPENADPLKTRKKIEGYLARKGFAWDIVAETLRILFSKKRGKNSALFETD